MLDFYLFVLLMFLTPLLGIIKYEGLHGIIYRVFYRAITSNYKDFLPSITSIYNFKLSIFIDELTGTIISLLKILLFKIYLYLLKTSFSIENINRLKRYK